MAGTSVRIVKKLEIKIQAELASALLEHFQHSHMKIFF